MGECGGVGLPGTWVCGCVCVGPGEGVGGGYRGPYGCGRRAIKISVVGLSRIKARLRLSLPGPGYA